MTDFPVFYLAHPFKHPTREGTKRNRRNASLWAAWLVLNYRVAISADWIWMTEALEENDDIRAIGLEMDLVLAERCDGVILCAARSFGVTQADERMRGLGRKVVDLTQFGFESPFAFDKSPAHRIGVHAAIGLLLRDAGLVER